MNEKRLVKLAKSRDPEAISRLYNENIKYIYRFVYYKTNHKEIAEDITSEVFVRAFEKIEDFKGKSSFKTWLYTIAKNLVIEWYRHKEKTTPLVYEPENKNESGDEENEESATKEEKLLGSILEKIKNERYRKVLELRYLMNYSIKETAVELEISEGNAKVIQNRALKKAHEITQVYSEL